MAVFLAVAVGEEKKVVEDREKSLLLSLPCRTAREFSALPAETGMRAERTRMAAETFVMTGAGLRPGDSREPCWRPARRPRRKDWRAGAAA